VNSLIGLIRQRGRLARGSDWLQEADGVGGGLEDAGEVGRRDEAIAVGLPLIRPMGFEGDDVEALVVLARNLLGLGLEGGLHFDQVIRRLLESLGMLERLLGELVAQGAQLEPVRIVVLGGLFHGLACGREDGSILQRDAQAALLVDGRMIDLIECQWGLEIVDVVLVVNHQRAGRVHGEHVGAIETQVGHLRKFGIWPDLYRRGFNFFEEKPHRFAQTGSNLFYFGLKYFMFLKERKVKKWFTN
jgi:hypothetical protein